MATETNFSNFDSSVETQSEFLDRCVEAQIALDDPALVDFDWAGYYPRTSDLKTISGYEPADEPLEDDDVLIDNQVIMTLEHFREHLDEAIAQFGAGAHLLTSQGDEYRSDKWQGLFGVRSKTGSIPSAIYQRGKQYRSAPVGDDGYRPLITTLSATDRDAFVVPDSDEIQSDWWTRDVDLKPTKRLVTLAAKGWKFWMYQGSHHASSATGPVLGFEESPLHWTREEFAYLEALDELRCGVDSER